MVGGFIAFVIKNYLIYGRHGAFMVNFQYIMVLITFMSDTAVFSVFSVYSRAKYRKHRRLSRTRELKFWKKRFGNRFK